MEASSPVLKDANSRSPNPHAPSVTLPLRFILLGIGSLLAGVGFLVARPDLLAGYHYNQYIIAVTHLFVLGFIASVLMGAMYQLVPVALQTTLHSEKLARWHFLAHAVGFAGMVWMFWEWNMKQVGHFASLLALGVGWFVYNLTRTLRRAARWDVVAAGIASSLFWLATTVLAGLYLAASKCWNFSPFDPLAAMHAHAHLGVVGVFVTLIITISYKLVPMFALSELQRPRRAWWSLGLLNAGLAGAVPCILWQSPFKFGFALVVVGGLILYGLEMRAILRARKRRQLDWGLKYFVTAILCLAPVSLLGLVLAWPGLPLTALTGQLENLYGILALLGVVGFAIIGMLYKIMPFLVWYHSYGHQIGRAKVPALADMYSPRLQAVGYGLFLTGLTAMSLATVWGYEAGVRWSCLGLAAGLAVFAINLGHILFHYIRPKCVPLPARPERVHYEPVS
jgi:hypothetical protein